MDKISDNSGTGVPEGVEGAEGGCRMLCRIEKAYGIYKSSEIYLKDVKDDYGKQKIARLRFEFARHELLSLLDEARDMGIIFGNNELVRDFFNTDA